MYQLIAIFVICLMCFLMGLEDKAREKKEKKDDSG